MVNLMSELRDRRVLLGVSGGIAAFKAAALTSLLRKEGALVRVIMTRNAREFVTPLTFATLSGHPVYTDTFGARGLPAQGDSGWEIDHLSLADFAEVFLIAPATANVIGKAAGAIADDLLSTALIAARCPVVFAPAMNTDMFENPILQDKIAYLKAKGYRFIEPGEGILACGREGKGRMAEPEEIATFLRSLLGS